MSGEPLANPPEFSAFIGPEGAPAARVQPRGTEQARGLILGDFVVGPPVGEGGFATVHEGRQISTGRKVAIKILRDGMPPDQVLRFQKEAGYLARFAHPNIVSVVGFGREQWSISGEPADEAWLARFRQSAPLKAFIALEWIDGQTLEQIYRRSRARRTDWPGPRKLAGWFAQAAGALAAVHATGLIHRDVKPGNLMVTPEGVVKLMDFGIARPQDHSRTLVTATGNVCGTLAYMSPEQVRAADSEALVGPATDVYSLAATFYELFTLSRVLQHDTQGPATLHTLKINGTMPERPRALAKGLPWEIETILMGGLETEVPDRYRSMDALEHDLRRFLADEPIRYRKPSLRRRMALGYRRHRTAANLAIVFILAIIAGTALYIRSIRHEQARTLAQKVIADEQRDLAQRKALESRMRLAASYEEQGRQELLAGNPLRAAVYLSEAYSQGRSTPATRFLLAQAMRSAPERVAPTVGHTRGVYTAEYSPDGTRIVTAGRDGRVKVWDAATGRLIRTFELSPSNEVSGAMFDPAGRRIVAVDDGAHGAVWDVESGRMLYELQGHIAKTYTPRFSPDGSLIVTSSEDGTARLWDAASGKCLHVLKHNGPLACGFFSPDGSRVITGSEDRTARIWDSRTGQQIGSPLAATERITRAVFSADDTKVLVTCADPITSTLIFDAQSHKRLAHFCGHSDVVRRGVFSPSDSNIVVTSSKDATARLWHWYADDTTTYKHGRSEGGTTDEDGVILQHGGQVFSAAFSHDGRRVGTASRDRMVKLWDAATGASVGQFVGHNGYVYQLVFSPDDTRVLTASEDKTARVWDAASGKLLLTLDGKGADEATGSADPLIATIPHGGYVTRASFSPDGRRFLTVSDTANVYETVGWAPPTTRGAVGDSAGDLVGGAHPTGPRAVMTLAAMTGRARAACFSPDGQCLSAVNEHGQVAVCDIAGGNLRLTRNGSGDRLSSWIAFSPDGRRLLVTGIGGGRILDVATLEPVASLPHAAGKDVPHGEFSPDGRWIVTASADGTGKVWDAATAAGAATLKHDGELTWATFSPDGRRILTASRDATAAIWDAATGARLATLRQAGTDYVLMAVFSRDGRRIVTASRDYTAKVWDAATGTRLASLEGHDGLLACASFSPDGTLVLTASEDGRAIVWDAESGKLLCALRGHLSDVRWAEFSADGSVIVTASEDRTARLWDAHLETRSPAVIADLVKRKLPWRLEGERLVPVEVGSTATEPSP